MLHPGHLLDTNQHLYLNAAIIEQIQPRKLTALSPIEATHAHIKLIILSLIPWDVLVNQKQFSCLKDNFHRRLGASLPPDVT